MQLRQILNQHRKYEISLNPKKSIFAITEGKLLDFVVSKVRMTIDPERTQPIAKLSYPYSKKMMQFFLDNINCVRLFILSFVEIIKPLQDMIKKDHQRNFEVKNGPQNKNVQQK